VGDGSASISAMWCCSGSRAFASLLFLHPVEECSALGHWGSASLLCAQVGCLQGTQASVESVQLLGKLGKWLFGAKHVLERVLYAAMPSHDMLIEIKICIVIAL